MMYVISIDIGLKNLGIVGMHLQNQRINLCKKIDLKEMCEYCNVKDCKLYHDLCMSDYVSHFIKRYRNYLNVADIILIERQPPTGLISIQELIVIQYRNKIKMISPNSMHKYFDITHYDYERRKQFVTQYAENALKMFPDFKKNTRKHDVSDAYCMIIFYLHTENRTKATTQRIQEKTKLNFERFNYVAPKEAPKEAPKGRVKSRFFKN